MLFAGGKNETARTPVVISPFDQVDYFLFSGNSNGTIVDTNQRLSVPRWDLSGAGVSMLVSQTMYVALTLLIYNSNKRSPLFYSIRYAVFVGGSDANKNVLDRIDVWTVAGDRDPDVSFTNLIQKRTAPTVAVIARATSNPIIVITGGDSENVAGCQPANLAEFIVLDPTAAGNSKPQTPSISLCCRAILQITF